MKPHRTQYWLTNKREEDPEKFDAKVGIICDLYKEAGEAGENGKNIVSVDEKTGISNASNEARSN